jgi:hydroxymethylpyrimidine pyrophosphatase-like HAD family hydrolase
VQRLSYSLLAIDLDGTLLSPDGQASARNVQALARAREAALRVIICTGRGLVECRHILETISQVDPVVVAGGSIIADPGTSRTIHRFSIDQSLVRRTVERLLEHNHPALVLKDPVEAGYDYLVIRGRQRLALDPVTEWWFDKMNVNVRFADTLEEDGHPEHTVRVGACGLSGTLAAIKRDLAGICDGEANVHHFPAVVAPEHASRTSDGQTLHVLEVFSQKANKWSAIQHLADKLGVSHSCVAAIGDEINDESMIEGAALGIAMANAVPTVKKMARRQTLSNSEDGVAHAIDQILAGAW